MRTDRYCRYHFADRIFPFFIAGLILLALMTACEDNPDFVGKDLLPGEDRVKVRKDTLEVVHGYTVYRDSIANITQETYLLGSQVDPYFGFAKAEIITQIQGTNSSQGFGSNPVADSVLLYMRYTGSKGELNSPVQIRVYEYTARIPNDSISWSNMDISGKYREQEIGTGWLSSHDSIIRVEISDETFINKFFEAEDSVLKERGYLQQLVKGLYITTDDVVSDGMFANILFSESYTELGFHYSNDSNDSLYQEYTIGQGSIKIPLFCHDYSGYPIEPYINNGSTNDSLLFLQSMSGVSPVIRLEGIEAWKDSMPLAINDAKLIIQVADTNLTLQTSEYRPSFLGLFLVDGNYRQNYDYLIYPEGAGGSYDILTNSYIFNLKVQIQSILAGNVDNLEMILKSGTTGLSVNRTVLNGWNQDPGKSIRLEITYTKL